MKISRNPYTAERKEWAVKQIRAGALIPAAAKGVGLCDRVRGNWIKFAGIGKLRDTRRKRCAPRKRRSLYTCQSCLRAPQYGHDRLWNCPGIGEAARQLEKGGYRGRYQTERITAPAVHKVNAQSWTVWPATKRCTDCWKQAGAVHRMKCGACPILASDTLPAPACRKNATCA